MSISHHLLTYSLSQRPGRNGQKESRIPDVIRQSQNSDRMCFTNSIGTLFGVTFTLRHNCHSSQRCLDGPSATFLVSSSLLSPNFPLLRDGLSRRGRLRRRRRLNRNRNVFTDCRHRRRIFRASERGLNGHHRRDALFSLFPNFLIPTSFCAVEMASRVFCLSFSFLPNCEAR